MRDRSSSKPKGSSRDDQKIGREERVCRRREINPESRIREPAVLRIHGESGRCVAGGKSRNRREGHCSGVHTEGGQTRDRNREGGKEPRLTRSHVHEIRDVGRLDPGLAHREIVTQVGVEGIGDIESPCRGTRWTLDRQEPKTRMGDDSGNRAGCHSGVEAARGGEGRVHRQNHRVVQREVRARDVVLRRGADRHELPGVCIQHRISTGGRSSRGIGGGKIVNGKKLAQVGNDIGRGGGEGVHRGQDRDGYLEEQERDVGHQLRHERSSRGTGPGMLGIHFCLGLPDESKDESRPSGRSSVGGGKQG